MHIRPKETIQIRLTAIPINHQHQHQIHRTYYYLTLEVIIMSTCAVDSNVDYEVNRWALIVHPEFPISLPSAYYFPEDKVPILCSYLGAEQLCVVAGVNKYWNSLARQDTLWSNLVKQEFQTDAKSFVYKNKEKRSVKALYSYIALTRKKHLKQVLMLQRVEQLQKTLNLPHHVAVDLLTKYN